MTIAKSWQTRRSSAIFFLLLAIFFRKELLRGWNTLLVFALSRRFHSPALLFEYKSKQKREWNVILFGISLKLFASRFSSPEFKSAIEQQWDLKELRALISFSFSPFRGLLKNFSGEKQQRNLSEISSFLWILNWQFGDDVELHKTWFQFH